MRFRRAEAGDLSRIEAIYDAIHTEEESGRVTIGWNRAIYPRRESAEAALERGDLYVLEDDGILAAAAVLNRIQVPVYAEVDWELKAGEDEVFVLHMLTVDPALGRRGYGKAFVAYYEQMAAELGCKTLRIDTNARNVNARRMYAALGFREAAIMPCVFNGIPGVQLVCLEKAVTVK